MERLFLERVLLLDDDQAQLKYLSELLKNDFQCDEFSNPLQALKSIESCSYAAAITDLHMPIFNGIDFIKSIRELKGNRFPVFVFSSDSSVDSKISCLSLNIKDYLYPSMNKEELVYRVRNHLHKDDKLTFENLRIDENLMQVYLSGELVELTQIEYKILVFLLRSHFRVPKKEMMNFVWPGKFVLEKTLNTHMTNLRLKMKPFGLTLITNKDDYVSINKII